MTCDRVSIVVLNWNRARETLACLESLEAADLRGASILVVDNGSRDGSVAAIRARFPAVHVLVLPENRGYTGGNNAGMRAALDAGAEGVLLLNNDTVVAPDFLPPLVDAMNASPRAAGVGSAVLRADRPDMHDVAWSRVRFRERWVVQLQGVNVPVFGSWDGRRAVEIAVGCCLLLNAAALRDVGLFDDAYFAYHEDVDWCLRARKAGWELFYEPYSRVYHVGSASTHALRPRPPAATILPDPPGLANAEPLPWNPVRAYLGARNVVRLMRAHASLRDRAAFVGAFLRAMPLEITAIVLDREGWLKLGRWTWSEMASAYFLDRRGIPRDRPAGARARIARAAHLAWSVPVDVLWWFPRYAWRAHREGRTAEFVETLRGLRDGALGRALPLDRLGLR